MPNDTKKLKALASLQNEDNKVVPIASNQRTEPPLIRNDKGNAINDNRNAKKFIYHFLPSCIRLNEFTNRIEIYGPVPWDRHNTKIRNWTDTDTSNLVTCANEYGLRNKKIFEDVIPIVAKENPYHPIKDYLEALVYKGTGYIRRLAVEYLGCEDSEYTFEVMKVLLLAMVQRVYHPGCKYDHIVVLVGKQGTGKSTFWSVLARDDSWFTDSVDSFSDRKKVAELIQGIWIVELGEMSVMGKSMMESIKAVSTARIDSYREAYGKFRSDHPRTAIFVGTTNNKTFLKDATGNRRFLVLPVDETRRTKDLFTSKTRDEDFDGALAEALHIFNEMNGKTSPIPLV